MAAPSWPQSDNKELLVAVANYLQDLLNNNASALDEEQMDSLQVAKDSLQNVIAPDADTLPPSSFALTQLYQQYTSNAAVNAAQANASGDPTSAQKKKFLEFISVLKDNKWFDKCDKGTPAYEKRMETARLKYNTRFPDMAIKSMQWLTREQSAATPMDTDNVNDDDGGGAASVSKDDEKEAEQLKNQGNQLLSKKQYANAAAKYTAAIAKNAYNAVYFSNRSAAYTYLKKYNEAIADARKASQLDPNYVKAYIREGLAQYELGSYEQALDAYNQALERTPATDRSWEQTMEKVEDCKMKIEEAKNPPPSAVNNASGLPNMGGGGAGAGGFDIASLLGNLAGAGGGGGGGPGGLDFASMMKDPSIQQMAQQFMSDPNAMKKMGDMMGSMGGAGGPGNAAGDNNMNDDSGGGDNEMDTNAMMGDLMQNPQKAQSAFTAALEDPEAQQLVAADPSLLPLVDRIKNQDMSALMELSQKPKAMAAIKRLVKKYYKK